MNRSPPIADCAPCNWGVEVALSYLPPDILKDLEGKLTIVGTTRSDGFRIATRTREGCEIIVLSERLFPKGNATEDRADVRYLIFVVLHEIAHAIKNHRSPLLDGVTPEENAAQEAEADRMAYDWFNARVRERNNPYLRELTEKEVREAQARNQELMKANFA